MQAAQFITSGYHHSALVFDDINHLQGILTTQDLNRSLSMPSGDRPLEELTVQNICTKDVICTFADESLAEALKRMSTRDLRQMPVVDRNQPKRVIGMVDRLAITTAYNTALTKQAIAARIINKPAIPLNSVVIISEKNGEKNGEKDNNLKDNVKDSNAELKLDVQSTEVIF